jgi:Dolichyl-phosphate-mannose-protein mannosyltransferase
LSSRRSYLLLTLATLLCLLPFVTKALNVDDPLFIRAAQQIAKHPLNPYGFQLNWGMTLARMSEITKNPPLASYYAALIGSIAGWSETALHAGFLLPALALVLGTYRLAQRFTNSPLVAAAATLLTPGILVSATGLMCDTLMLALWIWAAIFWLAGWDQARPICLASSVLLMAACAITKYFGVCIIPLLLAYSLTRDRRLGPWAWYFLLPISLLTTYQLWTHHLYGHGLFSEALRFASSQRAISGGASLLSSGLVCLSFAGGCMLPALFLAPLIGSRKELLIAVLAGTLGGFAIVLGWISLGASPQAAQVMGAIHPQRFFVGLELSLCIASAVFILLLAISDSWKHNDAQSIFLCMWALGTFFFAGFLNWTINARSVLPLIPGAAILMARRMDKVESISTTGLQVKVALALLICGALSFWIAQADSEWANSARQAATIIHQGIGRETGTVNFQGHWGFQYYMEQFGAFPLDFKRSTLNPGDLLIIPENNIETVKPPQPFIASAELLDIKLHQPITTMRCQGAAGFYASFCGPLPFAFGRVPSERYFLFRIGSRMEPERWPLH